MTTDPTPTITGRFHTTIQNVKCELELHLDHTGCVIGTFTADKETLEVMGGVPNAFNQVFGLIREPGGDTLAVFHAAPHAQNLVLKVNTPSLRLGGAERVSFQRQQADPAESVEGFVKPRLGGVEPRVQDGMAHARILFDQLLTRTNPT
jgi:hypothetical protein